MAAGVLPVWITMLLLLDECHAVFNLGSKSFSCARGAAVVRTAVSCFFFLLVLFYFCSFIAPAVEVASVSGVGVLPVGDVAM